MRNLVRLSALAVMLGSTALAGLAGAQTPPVKAQPVAAQPAPAPEACYAAYGLTAKQKIQVCTDVIDAGVAKGPLGAGLAYFNRGMARAQDGDSKGSISDYRTALRF